MRMPMLNHIEFGLHIPVMTALFRTVEESSRPKVYLKSRRTWGLVIRIRRVRADPWFSLPCILWPGDWESLSGSVTSISSVWLGCRRRILCYASVIALITKTFFGFCTLVKWLLARFGNDWGYQRWSAQRKLRAGLHSYSIFNGSRVATDTLYSRSVVPILLASGMSKSAWSIASAVADK